MKDDNKILGMNIIYKKWKINYNNLKRLQKKILINICKY